MEFEKKPGCDLCLIGDILHTHKPFYDLPLPPKDAISDMGGQIKRFAKKKPK